MSSPESYLNPPLSPFKMSLALSPFNPPLPLTRSLSYEDDSNELKLSSFSLPSLARSPTHTGDQSGALRGRKLSFGPVGSSSTELRPLDLIEFDNTRDLAEPTRSPLVIKRRISERDGTIPRPVPVFGADYGKAYNDGAPKMPDTPCKKFRGEFRGFAQKVSAVLKKITKQEELEFTTASGNVISFNVSDSIGAGNFSQAHNIVSSAPLFDEYTNDQVLFKCYQDNTISKKGNLINSYFKHSTDQYKQLIRENFPVARILNIETASTDGFVLVEKIPHSLESTWGPNTSFDSLDEDTINKLSQIKLMFQMAFDLNIPIDLSFSNVKVKDDDTVVLIDFREEEEDSFQEVMAELLRSFAQGNKEIYEFLRPRSRDLSLLAGFDLLQ